MTPKDLVPFDQFQTILNIAHEHIPSLPKSPDFKNATVFGVGWLQFEENELGTTYEVNLKFRITQAE